jgi:YibE/F-like protein
VLRTLAVLHPYPLRMVAGKSIPTIARKTMRIKLRICSLVHLPELFCICRPAGEDVTFRDIGGVMSRPAHRLRPNATRRVVAAILVPAAVATAVAMIVLWPGRITRAPAPEGVRALGTVTAVDERACPADEPGARPPCGTATVRVTGGGASVVDLPQGPGSPRLNPGDDVVLLRQADGTYTVTDHQRATGLVWLLALAALVVLTHGVNIHTSVAIAGTLGSLVLTGVLGLAFTAALHLTGIAGDDDAYRSATGGTSTCAACCWPPWSPISRCAPETTM